MATRTDPYKQRARELAIADGHADPDAHVERGPGLKPWPAWCGYRQFARKEQYGERVIPRSAPAPISLLIEAENDLEKHNIDKVVAGAAKLLQTPTVMAMAVMPDACPAGPPNRGTIPVGGVVSSKAIHPGMHSADICCSMALSVLGNVDPKLVLDVAMGVTHFGIGGRGADARSPLVPLPRDLGERMAANPFLSWAMERAETHFATQGNGNHFLSVGTMKSTGQTAIVTHHGSRGPGARLYKTGMACAERYRKAVAIETTADNAWIPAETIDGQNYWRALQLIREWTKANHFAIHDLIIAGLGLNWALDRFWNEHNFVFQKSDGLFYHGKGATPAWRGFAPDATDLTIIPLNMAEPILIVRGSDNPDALGFSPHGAGRNLSRTDHMRGLEGHDLAARLAEETKGLDVRFWAGPPDISELPSAYKSAASIRRQIEKFGLAEIVDEVIPYGTIMAGDVEAYHRRRKKKEMPVQ